MNLDNKPATPIKADRIDTQIARLYAHLEAGNTINFIQARDMGISLLDNRVAELKNLNVTVYTRYVQICNVRCKEYGLQPFNDTDTQIP